jgi:hypothetical protein
VAGYRRAAGWRERLDALASDRRAEIRRLSENVAGVYHRRFARVWAGAAGLAGGIAFAATMAMLALDAELFELVPLVLAAVWPLMLAGYLAGRLVAPLWLRHRLRHWSHLRSYDHRELARLEERTTHEHAVEQTTLSEAQSVALPTAALAIALPLTLHALVMLAAGQSLFEIARWMVVSGVIVGHAHLFLAGAAIWYAAQLRKRDPLELRMTSWRIYGLTIAVSAVPGILLVAIPPLLVALTGLVFIPAMLEWARRAVASERGLLLSAVDVGRT